MLSPPTYFFTLSLHDALPIFSAPNFNTPTVKPSATMTISPTLAPGNIKARTNRPSCTRNRSFTKKCTRSEEHTSELQSLRHLVCRLLLEKKKTNKLHRKSYTR